MIDKIKTIFPERYRADSYDAFLKSLSRDSHALVEHVEGELVTRDLTNKLK